MHIRKGAGALMVMLCASSPAAATEQEVRYVLAAVAGPAADQARGTGGGLFDVDHAFSPPMLNDGGDIAFAASLRSASGEALNGGAVWLRRGGEATLVAGDGTPAPGLPEGVRFAPLLDAPALNASGRTAFHGELVGPGVTFGNDEAICTSVGPLLVLIAREGDPAPGAYFGEVFRGFGPRVALNDAGLVAFNAIVGRPGDPEFGSDNAVWTNAGGPLHAVVRSRQAATDAGAGVVFDRFGDPRLDAAGRVAFTASLLGPGVTRHNDSSVWVYAAGKPELVLREGQATAGLGDAWVGALSAEPLSMNERGDLAFRTGLHDNAGAMLHGDAIWARPAGGDVALVARSGQPAPEAAPGLSHRSLGQPTMNKAGDLAFDGWLQGPGVTLENDGCVWLHRDGVLNLIARQGAHAPGTPEGTYFTQFADVSIADSGAVAFYAWIDGPGVYAGQNQGIWATDEQGALRLVVRLGFRFDANRDPLITEWRWPDMLWLAGGERESVINERGELVFGARFDNGDAGLVIASLHDRTLCLGDTTTEGSNNGVPDGEVTLSDFGLYLTRWSEGDPEADITGFGGCDLTAAGDGVRLQDFSCFLNHWAAGCGVN